MSNRAAQVLPLSFVFLSSLLLGIAKLTSYLFFHTLVELYAAVVSFSFFALAWAGQRYVKNGAIMVLGSAYGIVALIDALHALAYNGMGLWPGATESYATQLWLVARMIESLAMATAPFFATKHARPDTFFALAAGLGIVGVLAVWYQWLPVTYVPGQGLTTFKVACELVIVATLLFATVKLRSQRQTLPLRMYRLLMAAIVLSIATELCFVSYVSVFDWINALGHLFRVASVSTAFVAIVIAGVHEPTDELLAQLTAHKAELEKANAQLRAAAAEFEQQATTDFLTGVANRRQFFALAEREYARANRLANDISVAVFDLDNFKHLNDQYGHSKGDEVLRDFASRVSATLRVTDIFARVGGEEFAVVFCDSKLATAASISERVRAVIEAAPLPGAAPTGPVSYTVSIGVAQRTANEALTSTLSRADAALYSAKLAGRNRVHTS